MKSFCCTVIVPFIAACIAIVFGACHTSRNHAPSAAYYKAIFDSINRKDPFSASSLHLLDSIFAGNPNADPAVKFEYYSQYCGYYHVNLVDDKKALVYADSMIWLTHKNPGIPDYDKKDAIANISKGDALFGLKEYNDAYQYYYLGKVAAEKSFDPCTYSEYSYRLGMVLYKKTDFAQAAFYFKEAFKESEVCVENFGGFYRRQELLNNTALSYKKSGQNDSALVYYNKALDFINSRADKYNDNALMFEIARGVVYGNTAQIYAANNFTKAEELYKKSIEINRKRGRDVNDALVTQLHLATLYADKKYFDTMYSVLLDIKTGLDTIKNENVKTSWNQLMWKYYDYKKDMGTAYRYLEQYNALKDTETANSKKLNESDVTGQMRNLEAEYQMNLLRKDNKLNQLYFVVAAALFALVGIILLLILYNWRKSRKNVQTLTKLNDKINRQKEQLQNTLAELEDRNKEKDRILGIVAHDLRNPIAAISSLITILEEENDYTNDQAQVLELMQNACTNSIELINEILEFAINDNNIEDSPNEPVDINLVAGNCVKMLRFKAAEKKQKLQLSLSATPEIIRANPAKMWRVISNLITNAVKFSPSGAVIQIKTEHTGDSVQLSVQDKGIGIPDSIKNKVFDTHTEAKRPGTQGEKPFGLGLSICKQIVESYKGNIWFETHVGKGTVFYIRLPKEHGMVGQSN